MTRNNHPLDENLKRMLEAAVDQPRPAFQEHLVRDVLREVGQREIEQPPRRENLLNLNPWWKWITIGACAAAVLVAMVVWLAPPSGGGTVGQVSCIYGLVSLEESGRSLTVSAATEMKSGQRLRTAPGSRAQILLPDESKLLPDPRTILQIARTAQGPRVHLERGTLSIQAAPQAPGRSIRIESSGGASVKVLGTKLDVRVAETPSGARQTLVRVYSGSVELQSAGKTVLLLPGTEGLAEESQPPIRYSVVPEVNQVVQLLADTRQQAEAAGLAPGFPVIIDLAYSTCWTVIPGSSFKRAGTGNWSLRLRYPAFQAKVFTLEGAAIPCEGSGDFLSLHQNQGSLPEHLILKVPGMEGLLTSREGDLLGFILPSDPSRLSLVQVHFPEMAQVSQVSPAPIRTNAEKGKLILTIPATIQFPPVHY